MKKVITGLICGLMLFISCPAALADNPISLIINGNTINMDVQPQIIDGRVMVPARFVAEGLGATVQWDAAQNAVIITSGNTTQSVAPPASTTTPTVPTGNEITVKDDSGNALYTVKINKVTAMSERNEYSDKKPAQVVDVNYTYKNIASPEDIYIFDSYFKVFDKNGNVGYTYPNTPAMYPQKVPAGATCTADMIFGLDNKSDNLKISFYKNIFDSNSYQIFTIPIN